MDGSGEQHRALGEVCKGSENEGERTLRVAEGWEGSSPSWLFCSGLALHFRLRLEETATTHRFIQAFV